jgi:GAF domain-containing protein
VRLFEEVQTRTQELQQSLEYQTATSDVLNVISRSAFDLEKVLQTLVESATRLCEGKRAFIYRFDGTRLQLAASHNVSSDLLEFVRQNPISPGRTSAAARAALVRQTIHVPDARLDHEYTHGGARVDPVRTVLAVPILKADDLVGVLVIYRLEVRPFTEKQIELLETFADQAVIAIENARLFDEVQSRTQELSRSVAELQALSEVSHAVNSTLDLETVLNTIVAKAVQLSATDAGAIYVFSKLRPGCRRHHGPAQLRVRSLGRYRERGRSRRSRSGARRRGCHRHDVAIFD